MKVRPPLGEDGMSLINYIECDLILASWPTISCSACFCRVTDVQTRAREKAFAFKLIIYT